MNERATMMTEQRIGERIAALDASLEDAAPLAVALSGGVDSMTLACRAHALLGNKAMMVHAASPAVPVEATARVREHAGRWGWHLLVLDAGEFDDEAYLANPVNRCLFCKTHLYETLAAETGRQVVSGTNLDDLGDFRPGLTAAARRGVRHPFVEAGIDKSGVRALARSFGLEDLAELPASPCLSSRVETGIRIDADQLPRIDAAERYIARELATDMVRCRVRRSGIVVELDEARHNALTATATATLTLGVAERMAVPANEVSFAVYRRGSAFLRVEQRGQDHAMDGGR